MNGCIPPVIGILSARRAAFLVALAGAMLLFSGPILSQPAAADDSPAPAKPAGKPSVKPGAAKPAAKSAKPAAEGQPRSIAGDLLDEKPSDLDNQLLDGLPPAKKPPAKKPPANSTPAPAPAPDADAPPVTEGPVLSADGGDPLTRIGEQMRAVERRLEARRAADTQTIELQTEIVDELARLIEKLEDQQNSQQSASKSKQPPSPAAERKSVKQPGTAEPNTAASDKQPVKESTERLGKSEVHAPSVDEIRGLMKDVWGQLPAREREQMLQSPPEQFLPKYELLLEKYYKRLADEQRHRP